MKYTTVLEESGKTLVSEGYVQCLADVGQELGVLQSQLVLYPDLIDGNQFEQVFIGTADEPAALIYTEEQYARVRS